MRVKIDQKYYCSECNRPIHSWEKICSNCGADASSRPNQKTKATKKDFVTGNLQKKQNNPKSINQPKFSDNMKSPSTKFLSFFNYFALPSAGLSLLLYALIYLQPLSIVYVLLLVPLTILGIAIHKRRPWAYYGLQAWYGIGIISAAIDRSFTYDYYNDPHFSFVGLVGGLVGSSIIIIPIMYYIRKRKNLFIKNIKIDAEEKEAGTNNEIVVNSYGKNITPTVLKNKSVEKKIVAKDNFDTFEKIKKLSDLKDQGILTEEEFVSKKKELLERI